MRSVVVGHASLDRALIVNRCPAPGQTAVVRAYPTGEERRSGGVAQTCFALTDRGLGVSPVTCVASDRLGQEYRRALSEGGCRLEGVATLGERSPTSDLLYADDGTSSCLFDPGTTTTWSLNDTQARLITEAELLVLMIAPASVTAGALGLVDPDTPMAWVVKDDPISLAGDLPQRLAARADIVVLNQRERHLIEGLAMKESVLIAQTTGSGPVRYGRGRLSEEQSVPEIEMPFDPTGAGDAFAGGLIGELVGGSDDAGAVQAGVERAGQMLEERQRREG